MAHNHGRVTVLQHPNVETAAATVSGALARHKTILIVGDCWVDYRGRASSKLEQGERIVILKADGSVLVHRGIGYEPVNWQPPGCIFQASGENGVLRIRAVRRKPLESVTLFFSRVFLVSVLSLEDTGQFVLYASEEDMQKAVLLEPSLVEDGFKPITYEKKVEPGFVDVYGVDGQGRMVVVEIKRKAATREAALQLASYVKAVREIVNRDVRGMLVAPDLAKGVQKLLASLGLEFKALDPKKCSEIIARTETRKLEDYMK